MFLSPVVFEIFAVWFFYWLYFCYIVWEGPLVNDNVFPHIFVSSVLCYNTIIFKNTCLNFLKLRIEREKFYPGPGLEPGSLSLRANAITVLIWPRTLMELTFSPCGEFRWSPEGPVSQIHSLHLHVEGPGIFSDISRSVQMLKRQWGAKSNRKPQHLFIPTKTITFVPTFAVKDLPLGRTLWWWSWIVNLSCENSEKFRYLRVTVTNSNNIARKLNML